MKGSPAKMGRILGASAFKQGTVLEQVPPDKDTAEHRDRLKLGLINKSEDEQIKTLTTKSQELATELKEKEAERKREFLIWLKNYMTEIYNRSEEEYKEKYQGFDHPDKISDKDWDNIYNVYQEASEK